MRFNLGKSVMKVSNELISLIICPMAQNVLSMNCPEHPVTCNSQITRWNSSAADVTQHKIKDSVTVYKELGRDKRRK